MKMPIGQKGMKNMFIADTFINIKHIENVAYPDEEMIETLDKMLTEYGVPHCFTLPIESTDGYADNAEDILSLGYEEKDYLTFSLVYLLWAKEIRGVPEEKIWTVMHKISGKRGGKGVTKERIT